MDSKTHDIVVKLFESSFSARERKIVKTDLFGDSYPDDDLTPEICLSIIAKLRPSARLKLKPFKLVPHLSKHFRLSEQDQIAIVDTTLSESERASKLLDCVNIKSSFPIAALYLALLDSSSEEDGPPTHHQLACEMKRITQEEVSELVGTSLIDKTAGASIGDPTIHGKVLDESIKKLRSITITKDQVIKLTKRLGIEVTTSCNLADILTTWKEKKGLWVTLYDMVENMVLTPGIGIYVVVLKTHPYSELKNFLEGLNEKWIEIAKYIGFGESEIEKIITQNANVSKQLDLFLSFWALPDCGERTRLILHKLRSVATAVQSESTSKSELSFSSASITSSLLLSEPLPVTTSLGYVDSKVNSKLMASTGTMDTSVTITATTGAMNTSVTTAAMDINVPMVSTANIGNSIMTTAAMSASVTTIAMGIPVISTANTVSSITTAIPIESPTTVSSIITTASMDSTNTGSVVTIGSDMLTRSLPLISSQTASQSSTSITTQRTGRRNTNIIKMKPATAPVTSYIGGEKSRETSSTDLSDLSYEVSSYDTRESIEVESDRGKSLELEKRKKVGHQTVWPSPIQQSHKSTTLPYTCTQPQVLFTAPSVSCPNLTWSGSPANSAKYSTNIVTSRASPDDSPTEDCETASTKSLPHPYYPTSLPNEPSIDVSSPYTLIEHHLASDDSKVSELSQEEGERKENENERELMKDKKEEDSEEEEEKEEKEEEEEEKEEKEEGKERVVTNYTTHKAEDITLSKSSIITITNNILLDLYNIMCKGSVDDFRTYCEGIDILPEDIKQKVPKECSEDGNYILHITVRRSMINHVEVLIRYGANVNQIDEDRDRESPLHIAAEIGDVKIIDLLLNSGASVDIKDENGSTPLLLVNLHRPECVQSLLAAGANVGAINNESITPLVVAVVGESYEVVELLLEKDSSHHVVNHVRKCQGQNGEFNWISPLADAAARGNLDIVKLLIEKGANLNSTGKSPDKGERGEGEVRHISPLLLPCINNHVNVVEYITTHPRFNPQIDYIVYPLIEALKNNYIDCARLIWQRYNGGIDSLLNDCIDFPELKELLTQHAQQDATPSNDNNDQNMSPENINDLSALEDNNISLLNTSSTTGDDVTSNMVNDFSDIESSTKTPNDTSFTTMNNFLDDAEPTPTTTSSSLSNQLSPNSLSNATPFKQSSDDSYTADSSHPLPRSSSTPPRTFSDTSHSLTYTTQPKLNTLSAATPPQLNTRSGAPSSFIPSLNSLSETYQSLPSSQQQLNSLSNTPYSLTSTPPPPKLTTRSSFPNTFSDTSHSLPPSSTSSLITNTLPSTTTTTITSNTQLALTSTQRPLISSTTTQRPLTLTSTTQRPLTSTSSTQRPLTSTSSSQRPLTSTSSTYNTHPVLSEGASPIGEVRNRETIPISRREDRGGGMREERGATSMIGKERGASPFRVESGARPITSGEGQGGLLFDLNDSTATDTDNPFEPIEKVPPRPSQIPAVEAAENLRSFQTLAVEVLHDFAQFMIQGCLQKYTPVDVIARAEEIGETSLVHFFTRYFYDSAGIVTRGGEFVAEFIKGFPSPLNFMISSQMCRKEDFVNVLREVGREDFPDQLMLALHQFQDSDSIPWAGSEVLNGLFYQHFSVGTPFPISAMTERRRETKTDTLQHQAAATVSSLPSFPGEGRKLGGTAIDSTSFNLTGSLPEGHYETQNTKKVNVPLLRMKSDDHIDLPTGGNDLGNKQDKLLKTTAGLPLKAEEFDDSSTCVGENTFNNLDGQVTAGLTSQRDHTRKSPVTEDSATSADEGEVVVRGSAIPLTKPKLLDIEQIQLNRFLQLTKSSTDSESDTGDAPVKDTSVVVSENEPKMLPRKPSLSSAGVGSKEKITTSSLSPKQVHTKSLSKTSQAVSSPKVTKKAVPLRPGASSIKGTKKTISPSGSTNILTDHKKQRIGATSAVQSTKTKSQQQDTIIPKLSPSMAAGRNVYTPRNAYTPPSHSSASPFCKHKSQPVKQMVEPSTKHTTTTAAAKTTLKKPTEALKKPLPTTATKKQISPKLKPAAISQKITKQVDISRQYDIAQNTTISASGSDSAISQNIQQWLKQYPLPQSDTLFDLPSTIIESPISIFKTLAKSLPNWKMLGRYLELDDDSLMTISKLGTDSVDQATQMLKLWLGHSKTPATYQRLGEALINCMKDDLIDVLVRHSQNPECSDTKVKVPVPSEQYIDDDCDIKMTVPLNKVLSIMKPFIEEQEKEGKVTKVTVSLKFH